MKQFKNKPNTMELLKGKIVLITGATRGIGRGIAQVFAENGANVAFTYVSSDEKAREIENQLTKNNKIKGYKSDAADFETAQKLVDQVIADFGSIDILINNAGITKDNLILRMSAEDWSKVIQTNLDSVFNLTKAVIKPMMKQRDGVIINMSSVVGIKGNAGQANYAASKAGIIGFSKSIALELGSRNIRCNVVAPGFIETEMTEVLDQKIVEEWRNAIPLKRGGTPQDVANVCLFLSSPMATYITGQVINVDGGMLT